MCQCECQKRGTVDRKGGVSRLSEYAVLPLSNGDEEGRDGGLFENAGLSQNRRSGAPLAWRISFPSRAPLDA